MITKSKLRKLANSHNSKVDRKTILYAYKKMCKNIKSRARKGHYYYSFSQDGYSEELEIAFRFFASKHRDLKCTLKKFSDHEKSYEIRW